MDNQLKNKELLDVPEAVEEIKRHLWIESEKAGYDIGFDRAAEDWLNRFSDAWVTYHSSKKQNKKTVENGSSNKSRRAKSYFF
jgi:hypothetical protein